MRARSLKPALFKNEVLGTADPLLTILFEGLWCEADRVGRLEDRPLRIKAEVFPYREGLDIEPMLNWLVLNGFIRRYKARGLAIIEVTKFLEHQRPHSNEVATALPSFDEAKQEEVASAADQGKKPAQPRKKALRSDSLFSDSGLLTADSLNLDTPNGVSSTASPERKPSEIVFDHWKKVWGHPDAKLDAKRRARIEARLKTFSVENLCAAISGFRNSDWHTGRDPKGDGKIYDKIETVLRDDSQVEEGMRLLAHPPRPPPKIEVLSPVERVLRANGVNRDERVVSEQFGTSDAGMGDVGRDVRDSAYSGFRRIGS